jgi:hypothetical protein
MEINKHLCETILEMSGGEEKFLENVLFKVKMIDSNVTSGHEFNITLDFTEIFQMEEETPELYKLIFRNGATFLLSTQGHCYYRPEKDNKYEFFGFLKGPSHRMVILYCMKKRLLFFEDITVKRTWVN